MPPRQHNYYVYLIASPSRTLYLGVTSDLERRVWEHRHKALPGFSAQHGTTRLAWFEWFTRIDDAIAAEKRIKGWRREKKVSLIESTNPKMVGSQPRLGD